MFDVKTFRDNFKSTDMWYDMEQCVENSSWHREANVAVHTEMVVDSFIEMFNEGSHELSKEQLISFFALLFHDTGKPKAKRNPENKRVNAEGKTYFRFAGHEIHSARIWEDYAVTNFKQLNEEFNLDAEDIYRITWMIENHLPYGLKKKDKVQNLVDAVYDITRGKPEYFFSMLISDCYGRISDDHDAKKQDVHDWVTEFRTHTTMKYGRNPSTETPQMHILCAPSGSGKSTYTNGIEDCVVYSWDQIRIDLYKEHNEVSKGASEMDIYRAAFEWCNDNNSLFSQRVQDDLNDLLNAKEEVIVIDNVNNSKKARRRFISAAQQKGYWVNAVVFPINKELLFDRQVSRKDKNVPVGSVDRMYETLSMPAVGEVDSVIVIDINLPK